ncbi:MAG: hypothetical protein O2999_00775 [Nitrospirae bacterium]|nr:hypothetical protein [Nitrospirota bacterium]MDA1302838.1 hypothetical protein [Nitrospirota bacterium]
MKTKATFLCFFLFLLFPMWALADEVVDLKILEAQIIKGPADEWNAAKAALTTYLSGATQDENTIKTLKEKIAIAEAKLEKVVKITFGGEIGTSVKHANALLREKHVLEAFKKLVAADPADESAKTAVKDSENKLEELAKSRKSIQADLKRKADEQFQGFGFGIAIGALIDTGKRDRIESANLDPNGIVRVERDSNVRANFLLESHYFFTPDYNFPFGDLGGTYFDWVEKGNWGHGPFVAVQPGSEDLI